MMIILSLIFLSFCGCVGGMLVGISGAGLTVAALPSLIFLFPVFFHSAVSFKMALVTTLATAGTAAIVSSLKHYRLGNINYRTCSYIIFVYLFTATVGPTLVHFMPAHFFHITLASILIIYSGLLYLSRSKQHSRGNSTKTIDFFSIAPVALASGFASSMGGVGTGLIMVPYLAKYLPQQQAVGTSVSAALMGCVIASISYWISSLHSNAQLPLYSFGYIYLPAYIALTVGIIVGTPLGIKLSGRFKMAGIKTILSLLLLCSALFVLFKMKL
jgi:uncharacterized protein